MFRKVMWHLLGWGLLITIELSLLILQRSALGAFKIFVEYYLLYIALFYANYFFVLKRIERKPHYALQLIFYTLLELAIYHLARLFILNIPFHGDSLKDIIAHFDISTIGAHTFRAIYFLLLSFATWKATFAFHENKEKLTLMEERFKMETEKLKLEQQLSSAEFMYLKAQINPHFIYNTLNYLYNGLEGQDEKRAEALILLSDILRYNLTDSPSSGLVPIKGEVRNILDLIKLSKLRYDGKYYIQCIVEGEMEGVYIIPMILGTLVENIFKHGETSDEKSPAEIHIVVSDQLIYFSTKNKTKDFFLKESRPHTGIAFARKRLSHFYKDQFSLEVQSDKGIFTTELKIQNL